MPRQKTIIVGAGPVGSLAALYAAGRGDDVEIYELRGDLRDPSTVPLNFTKSINLALSERGINSMRRANCPGLLDAVLAETIPMHGRMIHGVDAKGAIYEESQEYDIHGRYIRAVDRAGLNKRLLDELDKLPNVKFFFNHKLVGADFKRRKAWFEPKPPSSRSDHAQNPTQQENKDSPKAGAETPDAGAGKEKEVEFDFMIGADGAHSAVRYHLMKYTRMDYLQEYIDSLWCEFHIDAKSSADGSPPDFKISPNHLHIWPGGQKRMFIAIPSLDKTFTSTLFLSEDKFREIDKDPKTNVVKFFQEQFPGVVPNLISEEEIVKQYTTNPHLPLISIKCGPYHYNSSAVILGDAAHAMVPFYGQGMNAGLEDVRVLYDKLDAYMPSSASSSEDLATARAEALNAYTTARHPDALAINDLALRNYREMASDVKSPLYLLRKHIEEFLFAYVPSLGWATQYSRVSFGNDRYSEVESRAERQKRILTGVIGGVAGIVGIYAGLAIYRWRTASATSKGLAKGFAWAGKRLEEFGRRFI